MDLEEVLQRYKGFSVEELKVMGITFEEINDITYTILTVNNLNRALLLETLEDFLACDLLIAHEDEDSRNKIMFEGILFYGEAVRKVRDGEAWHLHTAIDKGDYLGVIDMFLDKVKGEC